MSNVPSSHNESSDNTKPLGIQREDAIIKTYREEMDLMREIMKSAKDPTISGMNIGHHLGNALCLVSGDPAYDVVGLDEGEHFMNVFHICNEKLLDMKDSDRIPLLKELTRIASLFKTMGEEQGQFYGCHQLLEKMFDIAGIDKTLPESNDAIMLFSKMERQN